MSFKDLGKSNSPRTEKPEDTELRARAAAKHRAKEEKAARWNEQHGDGGKAPGAGGSGRREPTE